MNILEILEDGVTGILDLLMDNWMLIGIALIILTLTIIYFIVRWLL